MGIRQMESAILAELKRVSGNKKLRIKDIMEWSTSSVKPQEGEILFFLPELKIHCSVKLP